MLSNWRIRNKLLLCIGLLVLMVVALSCSSFYGLYAYRGLAKGLSARSTELPLAAELSQGVSDLRVTLSGVRSRQGFPAPGDGQLSLDLRVTREQFRNTLQSIRETLDRYRRRLKDNVRADEFGTPIADGRPELKTLAEIEQALSRIDEADDDQVWMIDEVKTDHLGHEVERLYQLAAELPTHLRERIATLSSDVRLQYRTAMVITWLTSVATVILFIALVRLVYHWIFCPLKLLVEGSRQVAAGHFRHQIQLDTNDEMSELADAMNAMTTRFRTVRDDLDLQVRERTKQVVRSEKLASVGFLAAGVAHEINNPLASIALCSESLETRVAGLLDPNDENQKIIQNYLQMIQNEAFRCKEITEQLLDFSRMGDVRRQRTELRELVKGVIEMVGHMGRYQAKQVTLQTEEAVFAQVNPQEFKQVVLNLITNALDSVDAGGHVEVEVRSLLDQAELVVSDDGCGMTEEVLEHLFEPFFTRRRGGEGTGLGLSISYSIVADHHGQIEAFSEGRGQGSRFVVSLPLTDQHPRQESSQSRQAA